MITVSRLFGPLAVAIGVAVFAAPASAQPDRKGPGGPGGPRGPGGPEARSSERPGDSEFAKLRAQLSEIEARLKKLESADKGPSHGPSTATTPKDAQRGPWGFGPPMSKGPAGPPHGPGGFGSHGVPQAPMPHAAESRFAGRSQGWQHHEFGPRGFEPRGFEHRGFEHRGFEHRGFGPPSRSSVSGPNAEIIRHLDRLIREIEELKHSLTRR